MGKLTFQAALGGTVDLVGPNTAGAVTLNLPTSSGDLVGTGSTGVVTTGMISGQIAVAQGGTGTATPALVAGTNVTITGTWPNQTINSTASGMVYPAAGIPLSTGSAWGSSYSTTGTGSVIALAQSPTLNSPILGTPQSGNFSTGVFTWPTFNQNTTGTAANITATTNSTITTLSSLSLPATQISGTVGIGNGGTGQTTASAAFNALSPIVTTGDLIVGNGANSATRLGCGLNGYFLASNGSTPTWTSTLGIGNGGTGLTTTPANGALDIGNGTGFTRTTLTAGTGVSITNASGSITIAATGSGGTVTSVAATVPSFLSVTGSPITTSGTLAISYSGTALPIANGGTNSTATPTAGGVTYGTGTAQAYSAAGTTGQVLTSNGASAPSWTTVAGLGTVTSVAATVPAFLSISGSPITTSGTLAISYSGTALPVANGGTGTTTGSLANCTVDGTNAVGYLNVPQNSQATSYTLVLSDAGKHIYNPNGTGVTYTIPAATSVAYPIGTVISFINLGSSLTIAINTDTMYLAGTGTSGSRTLAQYGIATATKLFGTSSGGVWIISGSNLT
jgi:hypothetical protein